MPVPARIRVRVQARDGKILGPAVSQPLLCVRNVLTGETLISHASIDNRSSGTVLASSGPTGPVPLPFNEKASRNAIVVQPPKVSPTYPQPGPYWLQPAEAAGELIVSLQLNEPSLLEFKAIAFAPDAVSASATMWVLPGMQLLAEPGLVLTIAGLFATVTATASKGVANIVATVTMMCGCPITVQPSQAVPANAPEPYWPSTEFDVSAQIRGNAGLSVVTIPLTCTDTSTFTGSRSLNFGWYEIWVIAVQANETNVGFARTMLNVT